MDSCLYWSGICCLAGAIVACFAAVKNYLDIRTEYFRAAGAGEISPEPETGYHRISKVIFQANMLPRAEATRRRLVRNVAIFLCLSVVTTTIAAADCAQPATSMNEPWFWLLTLAVIAILVSGRGDEITLPVRRMFGYIAIAVSALLSVAHLYVYGFYKSGLPGSPRPATGNLIPLNDHGFLVFISPWQSTTLIWLQFGAVVLALCGAIVVRYAGEREARNEK